MTHFAGLVLVTPEQIERAPNIGEGAAFSAVAGLVAQYCEDGEWGADGTRYDWFQVGGRFTGTLDGYEPWNDERNFETCRFCEGTGITTQAVADKYPAYLPNVGKPCHQCAVSFDGAEKPRPGQMLRFGYEPHDGNVMPARNLDFDRMRFVPSVLVTPDGDWHEQGRTGMFASVLPNEDGSPPMEEDQWRREFSRLVEENRDKIAILVDFHV